MRVTRLKCGGFIFVIRFNHKMADGFGLVQFMKAIAEIARGAYAPSIFPVWQRALLTTRDPPRITCRHPEYDQVLVPTIPPFQLTTWPTTSYFLVPSKSQPFVIPCPPTFAIVHPSSSSQPMFGASEP